MTDHLGFGKDKRREGNLEILEGKVTFRSVSHRILKKNLAEIRLETPSEKCYKASPRTVTLSRNVNGFCRIVGMINSPSRPVDRHINRYQA